MTFPIYGKIIHSCSKPTIRSFMKNEIPSFVLHIYHRSPEIISDPIQVPMAGFGVWLWGCRKSPFLVGKSTVSMAMFNSYVKLPEGNYLLRSEGLGSRPELFGAKFDSYLTNTEERISIHQNHCWPYHTEKGNWCFSCLIRSNKLTFCKNSSQYDYHLRNTGT